MTEAKAAGAAPAAGPGRRKEDRLSREAWLDAGLSILATAGPSGLRIEPVCRALKVTKGSFYWHFRDREDLLDALLDHWHRRETTGLIERVEAQSPDPEERIRALVNHVTLGAYDVATEVAMRQWAQADARVRAAVAQVDQDRLDFFARQFAAAGFAADDARLRASMLYSVTLACGFLQTGERRGDLSARLAASIALVLRKP